MSKKRKNDPFDLCAIYDVSEPIPEEFLDPDDLEPTLENTSVYVIEPDGALYFYCGNTKIKVTEHFAEEGKTMGELLEEYIIREAKKSAKE